MHLIFSTKNRAEILPKQHLHEVHAYMAEIFKAHHCCPLCVGGTANHVHILFLLDKSVSLSDIVRNAKSSTSKWINHHGGPFSHFCWQEGYGAFSISQSHVEAVTHYIMSQEEHHRRISFQDEFRRICQLYNAGLDERYAWD